MRLPTEKLDIRQLGMLAGTLFLINFALYDYVLTLLMQTQP
jgi:hypothetical protein